MNRSLADAVTSSSLHVIDAMMRAYYCNDEQDGEQFAFR